MSDTSSSENPSTIPPGEPSRSASEEPNLSPTPESIQGLKNQNEDFKVEVDRLSQEMEVLRGWFQTLVSGLMIAIVIAISIASWFAYRLLIQQQTIDQEAETALQVQDELLQRVTELEDDFEEMSKEVGTSSANFQGTLQTYQSDLELLRDRLSRVESRQSSLEVENQAAQAAGENKND